MKTMRGYLERLHRCLGAVGISALMAPVLLWVWTMGKDPITTVFNGAVPWYVLTGKPFSEPFNIVHAGMALDQPTIGKWLFLFTFLSVISLSYAGVVGWLGNRRNWSGRVSYAVCAAILAVFLLCILSWPFLWLIQYVDSMGFTVRRVFGLVYACGGVALLLIFLRWSWRRPTGEKAAAPQSTVEEKDSP